MLKLFLLALVLYQIELTFEQKLPWAYNLYPYGPDYNDSFTARDQDIGSGLLHLPFNISFMGHKYDQIWVHHAGFLAFQPEAKFTMTDSWPHPNYPSYDDPIFLAPFYCRIELNNDRYQTGMPELDFYRDNDYGRVMFRFVRRPENYILPEPTVFLEGDEKLKKQAFIMLNMAQDQVRDSVSGAEDFVAEYALVATWGNVTFLGISETKLELRPRNSYQVVLVTDAAANHTFAIFNYERIEWAASSEYGGDPSTGLSTTKAARIGFNRGNGTEFFEVLPYSNNPRTILGLHNHSNVNYRGRFIYRVDEWIQPAGCKNEFSNGTLFIWPRFGNMLGGQEVNITGPCFGYHPDPTSDYFVPFEKTYCRWGDEEDSIKTMAEVITMLRARCVMPLIYFNGRTNLWVSTDGGRTYKWKAPFTIVDPIRSPSKVELVNPTEWFKPLPSTNTLAIRWKREDLGWSRNESVEIQLFGYYEDEDGPHWDFLQPLGDYIPNNEYYEFSVRENWAVERQRARRYRMGAVAVTLNSGGTDNPKRIWSQLQPLGWWRHNEMDDYYDREKILLGNSRGSNWMEDQCRWWHEYQRWDRFWMYDLERCPCTIHFAVSDLGRWAPDPECNSDRSMDDPTNCQFHRGAQHCVVSIKPSVTGGGARCCFDFQGNLMYTNDTRFGSTSDRHHIFGIPPYNTYGRVPALSHYLNDIVPYYLCCEWSNLCDSFLYVRETSDCRGYLYPKTAAIYGDPHVMTFDGKDYTFNGKGEFRLVISTRYNFILQARFERPPNATFCVETTGGQINATRMTAIAAREDYSDTIEVRARIHPNQTWRFKCDLFINGQQWYVNFTEEKLQFFRNVSIVAPYNDKYMSNLTIVFNSTGAGVQVSCGYGMLHVKFSASYIMFQETEGLLGIWNNNTDDDFRTPDGDVIPLDAPPQDVNKLFAMKWRIELPADSLFTYSGSLAFDKFHDQKPNTHTWMQFVPWYRWDDPNWRFPTKAPFSESDMLSVCDGDEQCLYDAKAIGILEVGDQTKHAHRYYKFLHEMMKPVNSCGILSIKGAIRRTNTGNYLSGSRMTVSCQPGYTFFGYPEYICNWNGSWLPANGKPLDKFRDWPICEHWQITGFKWSAIAIAIAFTLCILAAIAYRVLVQNKNDKKKQQKNSGEKEKLNRNAPIQEEYTDEEGNDERYEQDEETDQDGNYQQDEPVLYRQNYDEDTDGDYYDERTRQQQPRMYKDHEEV